MSASLIIGVVFHLTLRSGVQKFPAWDTKAAPNGKCCEGYIVTSMARLMYQLKMCWNKGRLCWKIAKLFYFCHLKKLVRPENFWTLLRTSLMCYDDKYLEQRHLEGCARERIKDRVYFGKNVVEYRRNYRLHWQCFEVCSVSIKRILGYSNLFL